jgi:aminoglycoside phosphotransferase (APT) family kinase protein
MPRVSGVIPGPAPLFDEWIASVGREGQRKIQDGLIDTLVAVHAVDWELHDLSEVFRGVSLADALDHWTSYVEWAGEGDPLPALVEALAWCRRHQPPESPTPVASTVSLWGDARLGNLVFDTSLNVHGVLDWDLAGLGPREMDLGWHFGLEFMMETLLEGRLPGFATREEALDRYQSRSGYAVSHLAWHEVFALVRALAINDRHQRIAGSARRRANPMGEIILARMAAVGDA